METAGHTAADRYEIVLRELRGDPNGRLELQISRLGVIDPATRERILAAGDECAPDLPVWLVIGMLTVPACTEAQARELGQAWLRIVRGAPPEQAARAEFWALSEDLAAKDGTRRRVFYSRSSRRRWRLRRP